MSRPSLPRIENIQAQGKRVLVRTDFEDILAPGGSAVERGVALMRLLPTLELLLQRNATVLVAGHVAPEPANESPDLSEVAAFLGKELGRTVEYIADPLSEAGQAQISSLSSGQVALFGSLYRYKGEIEATKAFAQQLANLCDLFINDSFAACRHKLASTSVLPGLVESYAGLALNREVEFLGSLIAHGNRPLVFLMGGVKLESRLGLITKLVEKIDGVALIGGIAYTFLKSRAVPVGNSLIEKQLEVPAFQALEKLELSETEIVVPIDHVVGDQYSKNAKTKTVTAIPDGWLALDIGPKTLTRIEKLTKKAHTIIWYGPAGAIEMDKFTKGSIALARHLARSRARTVALGADTCRIIESEGLADRFDHLGAASAAALDLLTGQNLPGLAALESQG